MVHKVSSEHSHAHCYQIAYGQNWVVATEMVGSTNPKIFTIWPFTKKKKLPTPILEGKGISWNIHSSGWRPYKACPAMKS
jgi:hypothetical protein